MAFQKGIDAIKNNIAKAQSERDTWRAAGQEEQYLFAHFMVVAMELELDERLRQQGAMCLSEFERADPHENDR